MPEKTEENERERVNDDEDNDDFSRGMSRWPGWQSLLFSPSSFMRFSRGLLELQLP